MSGIKKICNVIQFPGIKNKKLKKQEDYILENSNKINNLMLSSKWDLFKTIDNNLLSAISEFGEHLNINPVASQRLNSKLATQILIERIEDDKSTI